MWGYGRGGVSRRGRGGFDGEGVPPAAARSTGLWSVGDFPTDLLKGLEGRDMEDIGKASERARIGCIPF